MGGSVGTDSSTSPLSAIGNRLDPLEKHLESQQGGIEFQALCSGLRLDFRGLNLRRLLMKPVVKHAV